MAGSGMPAFPAMREAHPGSTVTTPSPQGAACTAPAAAGAAAYTGAEVLMTRSWPAGPPERAARPVALSTPTTATAPSTSGSRLLIRSSEAAVDVVVGALVLGRGEHRLGVTVLDDDTGRALRRQEERTRIGDA